MYRAIIAHVVGSRSKYRRPGYFVLARLDGQGYQASGITPRASFFHLLLLSAASQMLSRSRQGYNRTSESYWSYPKELSWPELRVKTNSYRSEAKGVDSPQALGIPEFRNGLAEFGYEWWKIPVRIVFPDPGRQSVSRSPSRTSIN